MLNSKQQRPYEQDIFIAKSDKASHITNNENLQFNDLKPWRLKINSIREHCFKR